VAAVEPLDFAAPVLVGAPRVLAVAAAGPPDLAATVVGAPPPVQTPAAVRWRSDLAGLPPDDSATHPAQEAAVSSRRVTRPGFGAVVFSGGVAPVDREEYMAIASAS